MTKFGKQNKKKMKYKMMIAFGKERKREINKNDLTKYEKVRPRPK